MEELTLEPQVAGNAVDGIAAHGKLDRGEMHPDLMRPAGLQAHLEQRALAEALARLEPRHRAAGALGVERDSRPVAAVAADRRIDAPGARAEGALNEREIAAVDRALPDQLHERVVRLLRARHHEEARGVAVEAV